jgi:hypothetical protein
LLTKKHFFNPNHHKFILVDGDYDIDYRRRFERLLKYYLSSSINEYWEILLEDDFQTLVRTRDEDETLRKNCILISVKIIL